MAEPTADNGSIVGRVRSASISIMNANPQLGMWQAAGTAIAQAPNLTELRDTDSGGDNIGFNAQGHSARYAVQEPQGELALVRPIVGRRTSTFSNDGQPGFRNVFNDKSENIREAEEPSVLAGTSDEAPPDTDESLLPSEGQQFRRRQSLHQKHMAKDKAPWKTTITNGLKAFWKFFLTPSGFVITIYCLNIVAMLFFLLLKAAPAMNYPTADDDNSPRKKWLEICSQILNALFCVTGFGLAPWRFRDLYLYVRAVNFKNQTAMLKLAAQNKSWFRPPAWAIEAEKVPETFTGQVAPPTPLWKLGFTIWMMVLNTFLQAVLCYFMWGYNRLDRPSWATGTFIGLGCGVAMLAGLMSWWEGRKVKKIEGPEVKIVQEV
ncbi:uncharacterized protein ColSpa_07868 [Colletotrichum spaethianum]|uniref:Alpha-L-rhamnosidase C n=1 Tax=Colletotrichum spaethianum TaxID=700344 RepID=A0AA37UPU8_9PEZI|nr:uncharacterized protein ColSpa_07868 [Colletotrichum spaethianum]GKT47687.1 hypothetical protein ColSpa_07868 [Colletotrichum spaethianum]